MSTSVCVQSMKRNGDPTNSAIGMAATPAQKPGAVRGTSIGLAALLLPRPCAAEENSEDERNVTCTSRETDHGASEVESREVRLPRSGERRSGRCTKRSAKRLGSLTCCDVSA